MVSRDADHLDVFARGEAARQAECGDRSASWYPVPALLESEGYPQAASAGGVTPTTVDVGAGVVVAAPDEAGAEVEGVEVTLVKSRPSTSCTSPVPAEVTGCSSAPPLMNVASVRAASSWPEV